MYLRKTFCKSIHNKRTFIAKAFVIVVTCLVVSCKKQEFAAINKTADANVNAAVRSSKPNVIVILTDDIGYEVPGCNGGTTYSTPNIDNMAANGMRFTQCRGSALCSPARFMFMTGKYNFRNYTEWGAMNPTEKTLGTLFKSAGYKTCAAGKWQFDGGDTAIRSLGFDDYSVWNPYKIYTHGSQGSNYKDPGVYENGAFLPSTETDGKYSDDMFTQYVNDFIDSNKNNNFFVYYATCLSHAPYSPTPDDAAFATWDPYLKISDTTYFPSMVKYMDKKIGEIIAKLKALNLYDNTIIIFSGDNGTPHHIHSGYYNDTLEGGKGSTTELGVHVPLIVTWPNGITKPGSTNKNLVDFTDILATSAEITGANVSSYGTLDGISFYKQLTGQSYVPRPWIYDYYSPHTNKGDNTLKIWVQDSVYKLYDTTYKSPFKFYNIVTDINETTPIKQKNMTTQQKQIFNKFKQVLASEK